ncbi:lipoprotein LppG [Mycobacterium tuberculosis XTB13-239]|nr:lipoprotein LppG [Mycobacterium tuberculosis XTB13-239]
MIRGSAVSGLLMPSVNGGTAGSVACVQCLFLPKVAVDLINRPASNASPASSTWRTLRRTHSLCWLANRPSMVRGSVPSPEPS